jgi:hypothetical protein
MGLDSFVCSHFIAVHLLGYVVILRSRAAGGYIDAYRGFHVISSGFLVRIANIWSKTYSIGWRSHTTEVILNRQLNIMP